MSTQKLSNISLKTFRKFLKQIGCNKIRTKGGHETWCRGGTNDLRPITIQTHIDPIPKFIIVNCLSDLTYSKQDYFDIINGKKIVEKITNGKIITYNLIDKK